MGCEPSDGSFPKKSGNARFAGPRSSQNSYEKTAKSFDLAVFMDGFQVCRTLREEGNNVPIIMITAREEETDKVFGLELGADDYITKPFSMREVVARVRTNMRRAATKTAPAEDAGDVIRVRELTVDLDRHAAAVLRGLRRHGHRRMDNREVIWIKEN